MKNKNDLVATVLGGGAGAVILSQVDLVKLGSLDRTELAKVGLAAIIVLLGWVTNRAIRTRSKVLAPLAGAELRPAGATGQFRTSGTAAIAKSTSRTAAPALH